MVGGALRKCHGCEKRYRKKVAELRGRRKEKTRTKEKKTQNLTYCYDF